MIKEAKVLLTKIPTRVPYKPYHLIISCYFYLSFEHYTKNGRFFQCFFLNWFILSYLPCTNITLMTFFYRLIRQEHKRTRNIHQLSRWKWRKLRAMMEEQAATRMRKMDKEKKPMSSFFLSTQSLRRASSLLILFIVSH